ncbi:putative membrane protein [Nocardioides ginsengisegetis]|uniref:Putative membrane protein n=1 Tax=Nocardioides ginsengisegetis TaxID=661491 RepID=A0A7W3J3W1_9ACTN|nr:putative membrane protein [Nocardioides ginsengisegetis]
MRIISWLITNAVALAVAAQLFDGIRFTGPIHGQEEIKHKLLPLLLVALILGLVSATVKPVLKLISIPFILLSLGLFLLVINAAMLGLTSWLADGLGIGFHVNGFWTAVGGSIVITIVGWVVDGLIGPEDDRR